MHSDYLSPEDMAIPDAALSGAIQYLKNGDTHLPAWAIAALFLRSQNKERTRTSIIDEANMWVGRCRLGLVKFNGSPYDHEVPCVTMAGLDPHSEFTPKINISCFEVLIEMKSAIELGSLYLGESEMKWLREKLTKIGKLRNTQNEESPAEDNKTHKQSEAEHNTELESDKISSQKPERAHTKWFRETWEIEGKPRPDVFFRRLKKHKGKEKSPILDWYEIQVI